MHDLTLNGSDMLFFKFIATIELYKPLKSVWTWHTEGQTHSTSQENPIQLSTNIGGPPSY